MLIEAEASPGRPLPAAAGRLERAQPWVVRALALVTLGSGLLNLFSVMGYTLVPARQRILREFFPMEFVQLSRSLTLLIGLALVVSSIYIYKRKQRAYYAVLALASLSVLFHLTKGLNYEEATAAVALISLLVLAHRCFTVKSGPPDLGSALLSLSVAVAAALVYGIAGFWLLEPRHFGMNFTIGDSIHRALLFLSLQGDPQVVPRTRHARWFIESLYLTSSAVIGYAGLALFRPVIYRLHTRPHEIARAKDIVGQYGRTGLDFFKTWPDKSLFFSPSGEAFLSYGVAGGCAVVLGDPVGPETEMPGLIAGFLETCRENGWTCGFHQVLPDLLPVYRGLGLRKMKIGDDAIVELTRFSLEGSAMRHLRGDMRKLEKRGFQIREYDPPLAEEVVREMKEISDEWLSIPGRRERRFTLGCFEPDYIRSMPLVAVVDAGGRLLAFTNVIPSPRQGEATADLMRRRVEAPNGIMDYLFVQLFLRQKARGFERFNLGMAPMAGFQEHEEASPQERAVHLFFQHLNFIFSYRGLRYYKAKFASSWEPRYVIYRSVFDLPRVALALSKLSEYKD